MRCGQLCCSACLARWSFQVGVSTQHCKSHRHIPHERGLSWEASVPQNQSQPIQTLSIGTTKAWWFLRHWDAGWDLAKTSLRWWCITVLLGARLQTNGSTWEPQRHWSGIHRLRANQIQTATLVASLSSYRPHEVIGKAVACSQSSLLLLPNHILLWSCLSTSTST